MYSTLTIVRYPKLLGIAGFISMAIFRVPLLFNKQISFWKLMGCGKNGTFDIYPDWRQWAILTVHNAIPEKQVIPVYGGFIHQWFHFFGCEIFTITLEAMEGHGSWDGKPVFGDLAKQTDYNGLIAVLTRATIRLNKLSSFWKNVNSVAQRMADAPGFITSVGIGEVPWIKQATFSVWESKEHMKQFAYKMQEHAAVIKATRKENWYSEDMFVRFKPIAVSGTLNGINPLAGKVGSNK